MYIYTTYIYSKRVFFVKNGSLSYGYHMRMLWVSDGMSPMLARNWFVIGSIMEGIWVGKNAIFDKLAYFLSIYFVLQIFCSNFASELWL